MAACPLAIPETLSIILSYVDKPTLLAASTVSRAWREASLRVLWRAPVVPRLSPSFFSQLQRNGCHVHSLDVYLDNSDGSDSIVPTEFTRLLTRMPRLRSLHVHLKVQGSVETVAALTRIIKVQLGHQLEELNLDISTITSEDATDLFSGLVALRRLWLTGCATSDIFNALARSHMPRLSSIACIEAATMLASIGAFDDESLSALGRGISTQLQEFTAPYFLRITSAGLVAFADHCKSLTRLNLQGCINISPAGFETLIEASPFIAHVNLSTTCVDDASLLKLSTPLERAIRLETLWLQSTGITTNGVASIVRSCTNLRKLDIGLCSRVTFEIFEEPAWECMALEVLVMNGIGRPSRDHAPQLDVLYRQLGRLSQLHTLNVSEQRFDWKLFDMGHATLLKLDRLTTLNISGWTSLPSNRDIIFLTTRLGRLRVLKLDREAMAPSLLQDLMAVNHNLQILLSDKRRRNLSRQRSLTSESSFSYATPSDDEEPFPSDHQPDSEDLADMNTPSDIDAPSVMEGLSDLEDPYGIQTPPDDVDLYGIEDPYDSEDAYGIEDPYDSEDPYGIIGDPYDTEDSHSIEDPSELDDTSDINEPSEMDDSSIIEGSSSDTSIERGLLHMDTDGDLGQQPDPGLWNYRSGRSDDSGLLEASESDVVEQESEAEDQNEDEDEAYPVLSDSDQDTSISSENDSLLYSRDPSDMSEGEETQYSSHSDIRSDDDEEEEEEVIESSDEQVSDHSDSAEEMNTNSDVSPESDPDLSGESNSNNGQDGSEDDLENSDEGQKEDSEDADQDDFSEDD
ncbi:hypothetical protein BGZ67_005138 [Mortierella alpina]|nr:hypothetical protein BGZ67_005138 [Mortierella alpina]